jgi:chemotaxis response regulator CheB
MINVLLADDNQLMRKVIAGILKSDADVRLVGEASSFLEVMELTAKVRPDVVVMDIHMSDEQIVEPSDLKSRLDGCHLFAMSFWTDQETNAVANSYGAVTLLDKAKLGDELLPIVRECAQISTLKTASAS